MTWHGVDLDADANACDNSLVFTALRRYDATGLTFLGTKIDHGACLYFHHGWAGGIGSADRFARQPYDVSDHVLRGWRDFRNPDALADALLHPLDRAYTVPELYAWLERCGLTFGRWFEQAPYLPQCGMVAGVSVAQLDGLP